MAPPPHDPLLLRDRALRRARRVGRACAAGAFGLAAGLSLVVAHASARHSTSSGHHVAPAARVQVPAPQPVPHVTGAPPAPQPPPHPPVSDSAAQAPAPAPPPAVSGGS
jgi:hypothetical protein